MRVAVMADIHGFSLALTAVLADLATQGAIDETIVAGDLCEVGPAPAEVLGILRDRDFTVLQGNTDRDLVEAATEGWGGRGLRYTLAAIGDDGIAYLAELPFARRITPPGGRSPDDDLLAVHANPFDLERQLHPELSDRELSEILGDTRASVVAFGHVHIAYPRQLAPILLADVSAVGNPKDRDLRCKYGILTWDEAAGRWQVDIRRVSYPLAETAAQIRASGLPNPEKTLQKLQQASY